MGLWCAAAAFAGVLAGAPAHANPPVALVPPEFIEALGAQVTTAWRLAAIGAATADELGAAVALVPDFQMLVNQSLLLGALDIVPKGSLLQIPMTGFDTLDLARIPARFTVCNVHNAGVAIPEFVLAAVLSWNVQLPRLDAEFRRCGWLPGGGACPRPPMHQESKGQTIGIIGYGTIGRGVAERAAALGMRAVAVNTPAPAEVPEPLAWIGNDTMLPRLMRESDFVVIACPLLPSTQGLVTADLIGHMKSTGVLVNVARGPIVEEEGLFNALSGRRIGGAVLDVWWQRLGFDPLPSRFNFSTLPNVWLTPHTSYNTAESHQEAVEQVAANLDALAHGEPLQNIIRGPGVVLRGRGAAVPPVPLGV